MMRGNTITLRLIKGAVGQVSGLFQYDYGQKLVLTGVELPEAYEVHFSNCEYGNSKTRIGNASGVEIPDEYLLSGEDVHVWLFLHDQLTDGETEYHGVIAVQRRAKPTNAEPTPVQQDVITETIAALNDAVDGVENKIDEALAEAKASGEFDGFSPVANVVKEGSTAIITITDQNGTTQATVSDGKASEVIDDNAGAGVTTKTWSADKITAALGSISEIDVEVVDELPTEHIKTHTIYFVPKEGSLDDVYNEYMYINGSWELIGTTDIDVGDKADKADTILDTTLSRGRRQGSAIGDASFAFGTDVTASAANSHAEGDNTTASGIASHAEGYNTAASGVRAHSEGDGTRASGGYSHAEGYSTMASGMYTHAEGYGTAASNTAAHAEGSETKAYGQYSHAEGIGGNVSGIGALGKADHAEGYRTTANSGSSSSGYGAHAEGYSTIANGSGAHAEGGGTTASGIYSHAEGWSTEVTGMFSHAEGNTNTVTGDAAHAEGYNNSVSGDRAHVEGTGSNAHADSSHAEGGGTATHGTYSHAEGEGTSAYGYASHSEGMTTTATGNQSHSEGRGTTASGANTHAEGYNTTASGLEAHAEGSTTYAMGIASHAEGVGVQNKGALGYADHAEGYQTTANSGEYGYGAHAEGSLTTATGYGAHAEGSGTQATGQGAHAEGGGSQATAGWAHAEGGGTQATAQGAHTEGGSTYASAQNAHAEGAGTTAAGYAAHAEGGGSVASGNNAHAEGSGTQANGEASHAEGSGCYANGISSHAEGIGTIANGAYSHVVGRSNIADSYDNWPEWVANTYYEVGARVKRTVTSNGTTTVTGYTCKNSNNDSTFTSSKWDTDYQMNYVEIVGNGQSNSRSNARTLDWSGNEWIAGSIAHGSGSQATGTYSYAGGTGAKATGSYSHAEGSGSTASAQCTHAEGAGTTASNSWAHAEGGGSSASGTCAHAEGGGSVASGNNAHAEGGGTTASGNNSHSEGASNQATGANSHVEGSSNVSSGANSHAEGNGTTASALQAHSEGSGTTASGSNAHAEGAHTIANHANQHVFGMFNAEDTSSAEATANGTYVEIVGNGQYNARSNARTLDWSGNENLAGDLKVFAGTNDEVSVSSLKNSINVLEPAATSSDVGKFLKAKTVSGGKVTEYEFGSGGSGTVDNELSISSENPVQNKVITDAIVTKETLPISAYDKYLSTVPGSTVGLTSPSTSTSGFNLTVFSCNPGDVFVINSTGAQSPRAYAFINSSAVVIQAAEENATLVDARITAPANSVLLIVNDKGGGTSYRIYNACETRANRIDEIVYEEYVPTFTSGGIYAIAGYYNYGNEGSSSLLKRTDRINVYDCYKIEVTMPVYSSYTTFGLVFYNKNGTPIYGRTLSNAAEKTVETKIFYVPIGAEYFRTVFWSTNDYGTFSLKLYRPNTNEVRALGYSKTNSNGVSTDHNQANYGNNVTSSILYATNYIELDDRAEAIEVKCPIYTSKTIFGSVFYDSGKHPIYGYPFSVGTSYGTEIRIYAIPKDAKYFRTCYFMDETTYGNLTISTKEVRLSDGTIDIKVASSDSPMKYTSWADYVCTGTHDELTIQNAINAAAQNGLASRVILTTGIYHIDGFYDFGDGGIDSAICMPSGMNRIKIVCEQGTPRLNINNDYETSGKLSATFRVSADALDTVSSQVSVIRAFSMDNGASRNSAIDISGIAISLANNQKPVIAIDGYYSQHMMLKDIRLACVTETYVRPVSGSIGIRGMQGDNDGIRDIWENIAAYGFYEGFAIAGEHIVGINLLGRKCFYGFTFNNFTTTLGTWSHPITLINCADEWNENMPLFGHNGMLSDGTGGHQTVNLIDFNIEWFADAHESDSGIYATEVTPGEWYGNIIFTGYTSLQNRINDVGLRFWATGCGQNVKTINAAQKQIVTTTERNSYAANEMQRVYDSTLSKFMTYVNGNWVDG